MKFLCIPCDTPMRLQSVGPPERGSLSVVYSCPECGYEMAMLTNSFETQLVQSLGVRIGPGAGGEAAASGSTTLAEPGARAGSNCPFAGMIPSIEDAVEGAGHAASPAAGAGAPTAAWAGEDGTGEPVPVRWTSAAEARLERVPAFVRPMARAGIERFARERGALEVDEQILDAARDFFGM
jgi:hypothetical protein